MISPTGGGTRRPGSRWRPSACWRSSCSSRVGFLWLAWSESCSACHRWPSPRLPSVRRSWGWRADLIEGRRLLRVFVVGGTAGYIAIIGTVELALRGGPPPAIASAANAAGLVAMASVIAWLLFRVAGDGLFPEPRAGSAKAAGAAPVIGDVLQDAGREAPDPKALHSLERVMTSECIYRQEGLTIGVLALKLGLPEYKLRQLINQGLGYRNFNTYLNHYRIEEAKAALADAAQAEVPVLTIAMDAGFQSLNPFNRAFKAATGLTPTEYRRSKLGRAAS
jgi:AraC-like DNA-binding protein